MARASTALCFALACAALAAAVLAVPFVPSGDGPQHLLSARVVADAGPDALGFSRYAAPHFAVSGEGFCELLVALLSFLPWRAAYAAGLIVVLSLWVAGVVAVARALGRPLLGVVAGAVTAFSWCFYLGALAYVLSCALGLFAVALVLDERAPHTVRRGVLVAVVLALAAHVHAAGAVVAGGVLVVLAAAAPAGPRRARRTVRRLLWTAACGAPALAVCVAAVVMNGGGVAAGSLAWGPAAEHATVFAWGFIGGPPLRAWLPVVAAAAGAAFGLADHDPRRRALAVAGLSLVALACALPRDLPGWQLAGPRPLLVGMTLLLVLLPPERLLPPRAARVLAGVALVAAQVGWSLAFHERFHEAAADVENNLDTPIARGYRLPVAFAPADMPPGADLRYVNPFFNLAHLVAVAQGGFVGFSFAHLGVGFTRLREGLPPSPDRRALVVRMWRYDDAERDAAFADLMSHARRFDGVLAFEDEADHARWRAGGFVAEVEDHRYAALRFAGCRGTVTLPAGVAFVDNGYALQTPRGAVRRQRVPPGAVTVPVASLGCGRVFVALEAADGSALACHGAARVEAVAAPGVSVDVDCR